MIRHKNFPALFSVPLNRVNAMLKMNAPAPALRIEAKSPQPRWTMLIKSKTQTSGRGLVAESLTPLLPAGKRPYFSVCS